MSRLKTLREFVDLAKQAADVFTVCARIAYLEKLILAKSEQN
jgi:hypothetical protein